LNFIYLMRAKTEEWHLARDPAYVQYAAWIARHGLLASLWRIPQKARRPEGRPA
jgi:hypothetical protein